MRWTSWVAVVLLNVPGQINAVPSGTSVFKRETKSHSARGFEVPVSRLESVFALVSPIRLQCQNWYYKEVRSVWPDIFFESDETLVVGP